MSITYSYDSEVELIVVTAIGEVTLEDRAQFVEQFIQDPTLPIAVPILIDACQVTNAPKVEDMEGMAMLLQMLRRRFQSRIAYCVIGVGLVTPYTLASFTASHERDDVRTFRDHRDAIKWLRGT